MESDLREDFDVFKTQVAICGSCGLVIIVILLCGLLYTIYGVRRNRKEFEAKFRNMEAARRFTISRPKVYESTDPTSKLQAEIGKALSQASQDSREITPQPSRVQSPMSPGPYLNHGYTNLHSPSVTSLYSNLNSPSNYPNINLRSPSFRSDMNGNRVENFLNKTRQLYSQSSDSSPQLARTPTGNGNKDGNVFKFS